MSDEMATMVDVCERLKSAKWAEKVLSEITRGECECEY